MVMAHPHFLLFCDTHLNEDRGSDASALPRSPAGRWHFVLEQLNGPERLEAADSEAAVNRERLALLSVVRGLEALEQPSQVTLVTTSRYVSRGLRYGLSTWREADYKWERFGEQRPIRNADLWRRVDTALQFHGVQCRLIQSPSGVTAAHPAKLTAAEPEVAGLGDRLGAGLTGELPTELAASNAGELALPGLWGDSARLNSRASVENLAPRPIAASKLLFNPFLSRRSRLAGASWRGLAMVWITWWRGRMASRPVFYGA